MTTTQTKALITRTRNLIARLAAGVASDEALDLMTKINAATLKLDRAGEVQVSDELQAAKVAAVQTGREARAAYFAGEIARLRQEHRAELRSDPAAWMTR